ncbi:MAG: hypothetical protein SOZ52_00430 [Pyramidobacter sp.]|nr:hypothetical protein [Pyramidobacter sp.]
MKRFLALILVLAFASFASAAVRDCGFFTVDIPDSWTVDSDTEEMTAVLINPEKTLSFTVEVAESEGSAVIDIAKAIFEDMKGENFKELPGDGESYEFTAVDEGQPIYVQVFSLSKEYMGFIAISGDRESDLATKIFNSIEF